MVKALALLSGGLDSTLAVKLMIDQGIEVIALHFTTPFCQCDGKNGCGSSAGKVAAQYKLEMKAINNTEEFFKIIKSPKHGYGSHLNPCIDCRILMLKTAQQYLEKYGASFVFTGEVLGQRPMSQHRQALDLIERESGLTGLILRPLSAQWLEPTIPEEKGWVDRQKLLGIKGRGRRDQMNLAQLFEIKDYPCPAGGCLLTDPGFSVRLKDLLRYGELTLNEVLLLKVGRHFRLDRATKLIVGREEAENRMIESLAREGDIRIDLTACPGPLGLLRGKPTPAQVELATQITARYADHAGKSVTAVVKQSGKPDQSVPVTPLSDKDINPYHLVTH